jgi:hypothetical protein
MDQFLKNILQAAYQSNKTQFNNDILGLMKLGNISKAELPRLLFEHLKADKDLPKTGPEALNFFTNLPIDKLKQEPVGSKIKKVMSPEEIRKIPPSSSVWGPQQSLHASYPALASILSGPTALERVIGKNRIEASTERASRLNEFSRRYKKAE